MNARRASGHDTDNNGDDDVIHDDTLVDLALALPAAAPAPSLLDRLLTSVRSSNRFERFVDRVGALTDLAGGASEALLRAIDDDTRWIDGPGEGLRLFHIEGGPRTENAIVGFVGVAPGGAFPKHQHLGVESMLVLQGGVVDDSGREYLVGDELHMTPGSVHTLRAIAELAPLVYLVVAHDGVNFDPGDDDESYVSPTDPRM
jgi:quercetin dioxygenase-like cupin family protein